MTDSIKKYLSETPETLTRLLNNSKDLFKEVSHQVLHPFLFFDSIDIDYVKYLRKGDVL